jgi:hypothetical protein
MNTVYDDLGVLKSVNDYKIETKKLKIRSFYLYHLCQMNCVTNLRNEDTESCY